MAAERMGQRVGTFESELLGRELAARRDEIASALMSMGSMISFDQQQDLTRELAMLDNAIRQQGLGVQKQGLDQDWSRAMLQNDQFTADLELRAEDRAPAIGTL